MADIKSMTLEQAKSYQKELKGKLSAEDYSRSKEVGKVVNYIKTLEPEKYGKDTVADAYKQLSSGVTKTGGWTEQNSQQIYDYTGSMPNLVPEFKSTSDAQNYLNGLQNNVYGSATSNDVPGVRSLETITQEVKGLLPTGGAPEVPNMTDTYKKMTTDYGVDSLESEVNDLKAQQDAINAQFRTNKSAEQNKPVAQGVIEGRITQEAKQAQDQLDFIARQLTQKTDELNMRYKTIETLMNLTQTDYTNAKGAYDTQFNQAVSIISMAQSIQKDEKEDVRAAQTAARANAQIYFNAITNGNMDITKLSGDQKVALNKMELQAGLPVGFFSSLKVDPKANIVSTTSNNGQIQVLMKQADGSLKLQTYGTANADGTKPTGGTAFQSAIQQGIGDLKQGESWGTVWNRIKSQYPNMDNSLIDSGLGTEWKEAGAYEKYKAKTSSTGTTSEVSKAKQLIQGNGGSAEDLSRVETDSAFRAWVLANYY